MGSGSFSVYIMFLLEFQHDGKRLPEISGLQFRIVIEGVIRSERCVAGFGWRCFSQAFVEKSAYAACHGGVFGGDVVVIFVVGIVLF